MSKQSSGRVLSNTSGTSAAVGTKGTSLRICCTRCRKVINVQAALAGNSQFCPRCGLCFVVSAGAKRLIGTVAQEAGQLGNGCEHDGLQSLARAVSNRASKSRLPVTDEPDRMKVRTILVVASTLLLIAVPLLIWWSKSLTPTSTASIKTALPPLVVPTEQLAMVKLLQATSASEYRPLADVLNDMPAQLRPDAKAGWKDLKFSKTG